MILKQYYLGCLAHASYLIGDERTGAAAVVDPQRDVDGYLEDCRRLGLSIRKVFLTHFHADFVSGHLELRERAGAEIHLGARASAEYAFVPLHDGDMVELGSVRVVALETPGHTPESISLLVYDLERDPARPHAVLTGDTLFIGDVGRPDLLASFGVTSEELAGMMYDSLRSKLLPLPDETLVYPAHGAGSACGKNLSTETVSTLGAQKRLNWALQPMERAEFVRRLVADVAEPPPYFAFDAVQNRRERPTLEASLRASSKQLSLDEWLRLAEGRATVLDVREPADFAAGHLAGSFNIPLSGKYANWAGTLLDRERPIALLAPPRKEVEAAMRLGRIGFDHVAGYLAGGASALAARPELLRTTRRIEPRAFARELAGEDPPLVLDVRTSGEWSTKRIGNSLNFPLNGLCGALDRLRSQVAGRSIVVHCQTGYRSSVAASILEQHGIRPVADLAGGIIAWENAELAVHNPVS